MMNEQEDESVSDLRMSSSRYHAARSQLVEMVDESHARTPKRRSWIIGITTAVLIGGAVTTAFAVATHKPVENHMEAHCRAGDQIDSLDVGMLAGSTDPKAIGAFDDERAGCAAMWSQGILTHDATALNVVQGDVVSSHPVPPLVVCVNISGMAVVVPSSSEQVCGALGLANSES